MRKLVLFSLALAFGLATTATAEVKPGGRAVDFAGRTAKGESFQLAKLRGKVVLVDFWASWCEPCKKELPLLNKMAQRLRDQNIEIVTVNIDDDPQNAAAFMRSRHLDTLTVVADSDKRVVDKSGVIRAVNAGFDDGDENKIEQQLKGLADK